MAQDKYAVCKTVILEAVHQNYILYASQNDPCEKRLNLYKILYLEGHFPVKVKTTKTNTNKAKTHAMALHSQRRHVCQGLIAKRTNP